MSIASNERMRNKVSASVVKIRVDSVKKEANESFERKKEVCLVDLVTSPSEKLLLSVASLSIRPFPPFVRTNGNRLKSLVGF